MPIYEYHCSNCGKEFELFKAITDGADPACKFCNGAVRKLISRSSFHLKGSGWYVTDYAKKGSSCSEKSQEESSSSVTKTPKDASTSTSTSTSTPTPISKDTSSD